MHHESPYHLIFAVLNRGYAEEVMAAWSAATEAAKTAFDTAVADLGLPPGGAG